MREETIKSRILNLQKIDVFIIMYIPFGSYLVYIFFKCMDGNGISVLNPTETLFFQMGYTVGILFCNPAVLILIGIFAITVFMPRRISEKKKMKTLLYLYKQNFGSLPYDAEQQYKQLLGVIK